MNTCPVLIGREREMHALRTALAAPGSCVLVAGEAGIGKSRLVREFCDLLTREIHVIWARPESISTFGQFSLILDLLESLHVGVPSVRVDAKRLMDELSTRHEPGREPSARYVAALLRGMLAEAGKSRVLILDDLHLADELSQAVVAHVVRSGGDEGTFVVGTYRTGDSTTESLSRFLDLLNRDRLATIVEVEPLTPENLTQMLSEMWGREPEVRDVEEIARLADGVPFFIEELAAARLMGSETVPDSISRAVSTRLDPLDASSRTILRAASLMYGPIDPLALADATDSKDTKVAEALILGVRTGILTDQDGRLAFRHSLIRRALSSEVVSVESRSLHRAIAESIETRSEGAESRAPELFRHWVAAGEFFRASVHGLTAAQRALSAGAFDLAARLYDEILDLDADAGVRADVTLGKGLVACRVGNQALGERYLRDAIEQYVGLARMSEAAEALSRLVTLKQTEQDVEVLELLRYGRAITSTKEHEVMHARLTIEHGYVLARIFDDRIGGLKLLLEGAEKAAALGDVRLLAQAKDGLAWVYEFNGDLLASQESGQGACKLALSADDPELIARLHGNQALRLAMQGNVSSALTHLDAAHEAIRDGFDAVFTQPLNNMRSWILWRMGEPRQAGEIAGRLEATKWSRQYAGVVRIWAALECGDEKRARSYLDAWWQEVGSARRAHLHSHPADLKESSQSEVLLVLGELIAGTYTGVPSTDLLALAEAYQDLCEVAPTDTKLMVRLLRARLVIQSGDFESATSLLAVVEKILQASPYQIHKATLYELRGLIAGVSAEGMAQLDRAAETFADAVNASDQVRCLRESAEVAAKLGVGKLELARRLKAARSLAMDAGCSAEVNHIEAVMRAHGVRPRAGRPKGSGREPDQLSAREQEIVALLASGASNTEIAGRLFLSGRTVQDHVANAQRRLGVTGRAGLAAWAAKKGLV